MMFAYRRDEIMIYGDFPANGYIATRKLPPDFKPADGGSANGASATSLTSITDPATEIDRCRDRMIALRDKWADVEDCLNAEDATQQLTPELPQSFRRAANLFRSADWEVAKILKRLTR
jgi:hypothetical protein